jgi:transcriptional regulator with PAS, ATPase and Fis domain
MIRITEMLLDHMVNAAILFDGTGAILKVNDAASFMLKAMGLKSSLTSMKEIDPAFPLQDCENRFREGTVRIGGRSRLYRIFPVELDGKDGGSLCLFDTANVLKIMDFDSFLDLIDAGIEIVDGDGTMEHLNQTLENYIGLGIKKWVGRNLQEAIDARVMTDGASTTALKAKKTIDTSVTFTTGTTVLFHSVPVFDDQGIIRKVISTGRDVTRMIKLENELSNSETLKDQYYKRLNTLEMLFGGDQIVYASEGMRRVIEVSVRAGKSDSPVFIWGESGVGKEMIAKMIHKTGTRGKGPFVAVNCSAIPSELLESEFFGYEEGAFTGAKSGGRKGLFEEAEKGTLYLDEISELPLTMQSKLLRVIQEQEYMRVGSSRTVPTNVRIISSTNLSREELADGTRFRRDLFYRLSVLPIFVPPLRDRRDDILPLTRFFLKQLNRKYSTAIRLSNAMIPRFYNYDWPGNVRELRNMIERLIVMANSDEVGEVEYELVNQLEVGSLSGVKEEVIVSRLMPMRQAMEKVENTLFRLAYKEGGSIEKAAELLGISPATIYRKIKGQNMKVRDK